MDDETRLLIAAADGDRLALSAFVRATQSDVWRFCAHLVDRDAADDLTQEVYLRAMRSIPTFRGDSRARTWLLAVARNVAVDEIRRRQRHRRLAAPHHRDTPDATDAVAVQHLIAELPLPRREAFVLTQLLGFNYQDAARAAGVPVGTIRSRVARARQSLLAALDDAESAGA